MKAPRNTVEPPRPLGEAGQALWDRIQGEYVIADSAGIEVLAVACEATDRAASLAARIAVEGESVRTSHGLKAHPCLKDEAGNRALVVRCLQRLGLLDEPIKGMGRPSTGLKGKQDADE